MGVIAIVVQTLCRLSFKKIRLVNRKFQVDVVKNVTYCNLLTLLVSALLFVHKPLLKFGSIHVIYYQKNLSHAASGGSFRQCSGSGPQYT